MDFANFALLFFLTGVAADAQHSLAELPKIFESERVLISSLKDYVQIHGDKLEELCSRIPNSQNGLSAWTENFLRIEELIQRDDAEAIKSVHSSDFFIFPKKEYLDACVTTILVLQDFYKFPATSLAEGELGNVKSTRSFTGEESYEVAARGLDLILYSGCLDWFDVAVKKGRLPRWFAEPRGISF